MMAGRPPTQTEPTLGIRIAGAEQLRASPAAGALGIPPGPCRAVFGGSVRPLSHEQRQDYRWGLVEDSAWAEALERQRQLLAALRNPEQNYLLPQARETAVSLTCTADPADGLRLSFLCAVDGDHDAAVHARAAALWQSLSAIFPYDYQLYPFTCQKDLDQHAGFGLLAGLTSCRELVEISRFETFMATGSGQAFLLGNWTSLPHADEQIWRTLSGLQAPALLSIRVQPTTLGPAEWQMVSNLGSRVRETVDKIDHPFAQALCRQAAGLYGRRMEEWLDPYLVQVHLAVVGEVPEYAARAIGSALSYGPENNLGMPGYQLRYPADTNQLRSWAGSINHLTFAEPAHKLNSALSRLRLLAGTNEALAVFRWPYLPPKEHTPGLIFY